MVAINLMGESDMNNVTLTHNNDGVPSYFLYWWWSVHFVCELS